MNIKTPPHPLKSCLALLQSVLFQQLNISTPSTCLSNVCYSPKYLPSLWSDIHNQCKMSQRKLPAGRNNGDDERLLVLLF